jgi:hypothetical protein
MLEIAKQVEPLLHVERTCLGVRLGRERIDVTLAIDAHRRHLRERCVEGARLTAGRILRQVDALIGAGRGQS